MTAPWEMEKKKMNPTRQPEQIALMAVGVEDGRHSGEAHGGADRSDQQQRFAPQLIDDGHGEKGRAEVHRAQQHRLLVRGEAG